MAKIPSAPKSPKIKDDTKLTDPSDKEMASVKMPTGEISMKNGVIISINPNKLKDANLNDPNAPGAARNMPGGKGGIVSHFDQFFGQLINEKMKREYVAGLSKSTAVKRMSHWAKTSKMDPKDPAAYAPAPGDATAKTKESKYTKAYKQKFGEEVESIDEEAGSALSKKASASGVSLSTLRTVYKRGVAAWRTGHRPGTTPQQWGMARVNSYIAKGKGTYGGADKDLREEEEVSYRPEVQSFSSFVEEMELGHAEEFFNITEEEYEDWGEPDEDGVIYQVVHEAKGSCWTGYQMVGMKTKGGRQVPNCVKEATEYQGRSVKLSKPFLTPGGPKKRSVYVKNDKGNVVKVNFGDPNMTIKKNIPARRKSFRARHGCDVDAGPRWKAKYWSCKAW